MKEIPLNKGKVALVDDDDYERVMQFRWFAWNKPNSDIWYAIRANGYSKWDTSTDRKMPQFLLGSLPRGLVYDHINHNGLDNRKENLRVATYAENARNCRPRRKRAA
jgi:hypothetical protein